MSDEPRPKIRLLLAVYSRELKTAIFLTLSGERQVQIVATAMNTAELLTYSRTFRPDAIVLEWELPGRPMAEVLPELSQTDSPPQIFIISKPSSHQQLCNIKNFDHLSMIDSSPEDLVNMLEQMQFPDQEK